MNETLSLSPTGIKLIQHFEGCLEPIGNGRFAAYLDPVNVPTIGWGHTNHHGRQFRMGDVWTQSECDAEFVSDMKRFERAVKQQVTSSVSLGSWAPTALTSNTPHSSGASWTIPLATTTCQAD